MERETWDSLLSFLLAINDALLAPPAVKDDVGDQLCERVLGVLYEIWLIACVKSFPGPTLWKTFQVRCNLRFYVILRNLKKYASSRRCAWIGGTGQDWSHNGTGTDPEVLDLCSFTHLTCRVNLALLAHQLKFMYGGKLPPVQLPREDQELVPESMTRECVAQASFRLLIDDCPVPCRQNSSSGFWTALATRWNWADRTRCARRSSSSSTPSCRTAWLTQPITLAYTPYPPSSLRQCRVCLPWWMPIWVSSLLSEKATG